MKKKLSMLLSAAMLANVIASVGVQSFAQESTESAVKLSSEAVKREEILPSIIKPGVPEKTYLDIDSYQDAIEKIKKDLKTDIDVPVFISSNSNEVKGKLSKGVGVTLYKITEEESRNKRFTPSSSNLLSDNKYSISLENGEFIVTFNHENIKPKDKIGVCISYSLKVADNEVVNKTYVTEATYIGVNAQKIGINGKIDVSKVLVGLPSDAKVEEIEKFDSSTSGAKELKLKVIYENKETMFSVPVTVSDEEISDSNLRISGSNRFETNIESIKRSFKEKKVDTVLVASGMSFADPLSAGPLAMKLDAPIIFASKNGLSDDAIKLINNLGAKNVILIGGKNTVSENVEKQLEGKNIRRIAGNNRYETSKLIAKEYGASRHIIITDGRKFADALSATPLSKKISAPILLVNNSNSITESINVYHDAYIVGGKNSVSIETENRTKGYMKGKNVYRVYGSNRAETSTQVATLTKFSENILVNGSSFPDALSSINLLNSDGKNLLLSGKDKADKEVKELLNGKVNYIIGGYSTISKDILGY